MSAPAIKSSLSDTPPKAGLILFTLIVGAVVANVNLGVANVALPDIGRDLGANQVQLTMVASMFTLGLAASVMYLGAIGDKYGRKKLLLAGSALAIPASLLAGFAPNIGVLIGARLLGGIAAGLMFPTTLSLISALWRGAAQTRAISMWSGIGAGAASIGGLVGGALLLKLPWGSVFLFTVPFALVVLILGWIVVPWHAGEDATAVDHLGGVLSVFAVASLILGLQILPNGLNITIGILALISVVAFILFYIRQKRAPTPLVDLKRAKQPTFWVAAASGTISFGSLMGALFLGQQFTQNVLRYDSFTAALVSLPTAVGVSVTAPLAGKKLMQVGSRPVMAVGMGILCVAFIAMAVTWREGAHMPIVMISYLLCGIGVGMVMAPGSHSLMASLPTSRAGMGSAFTDLTRDFGGAVMQAVMGTALAISYSHYFTKVFDHLTPEQSADLTAKAAHQMASGFEGAAEVAKSYPQAAAHEVMQSAAIGFTHGKTVAYAIGAILCIVAIILVLWKYPKKQQEFEFFAKIAEESALEREDLARREAAKEAEAASAAGNGPST